MKISKKIISLVLAVVMLASCMGVAAFAAERENCIPSIVIPGIFQSETKYYVNGRVAVNEYGQPYAAPFFIDSTLTIVGAALEDALIPIADMLISQEDKDEKAAHAVADLLGEVLMSKNLCDETGHFVQDIRATKYNKSYAELSKYDRDYIMGQLPLQNYVDLAGEENLYVFSYASLGNMKDTALELYDFIQHVKEDSGSDKVNLVPISQGGSVANGLMQVYEDKGRLLSEDVDRVVFVVPALDGSALVGEIFQYGIIDDDFDLYNTMLPSLMGEEDWLSYLINIVLRIMPNANLNSILDIAVDTLIKDYMRYSTLLWGLCPSTNYPACREKYLLDEGLEQILEQTDWFYNAQLKSDEHILEAVENGVEVFDIVDYNVPLYHLVDCWDDVNADGVIHLDSTSMGAYSAGVDKVLPEDYVPACNNCKDASHDHSDPNGIVDACTGLLPETTFYFYNQDHEKTASNDVIMKLVSDLLTDDSFVDVFSYPEKYPQFNTGRNTKRLTNKIKELEAIDTSALSPEVKAELDAAIAQAQAVLDNTVVDLEAQEAAEERLEAISYKIENGTDMPTDSGSDDSTDIMLFNIIKFLSDLFYKLFGGLGFSEM